MPDSIHIQLENLTKVYPGQTAPAVDNLSVSIRRGEIVALVGPSGCGKTTTMKLINRLVEPTSGRILIDGADVTNANPNELRRSIGYVIQQGGLFPHMKVRHNIASVLKLLKWPNSAIKDRVEEMLELVGLDASTYGDRYPKELSGGQRQRVGVARALAADASIMLMDEPFGAIDPIVRGRMQNEFLRLQETIKKTIVLVTHDLAEAIKMGDRIIVVGQNSKVEQFDTPYNILRNPANDFVKDFLGSNPDIRTMSLKPVSTDSLVTPTTVERSDLVDGSRHQGPPALVINDDRPIGWIYPGQDLGSVTPVQSLNLSSEPNHYDALNAIIHSGGPGAVLTHSDGRLAGILLSSAALEQDVKLDGVVL